MATMGEAGRRGEAVRSDCWVRIEPKARGGLKLRVTTKVEAMYGDAVRAHCREVLQELGVKE